MSKKLSCLLLCTLALCSCEKTKYYCEIYYTIANNYSVLADIVEQYNNENDNIVELSCPSRSNREARNNSVILKRIPAAGGLDPFSVIETLDGKYIREGYSYDFSSIVTDEKYLDQNNNLYLGESFSCFYYNSETFVNNSITLPTTIDGFETLLTSIKEVNNDYYPLYIGGDDIFLIDLALQYGINYVSLYDEEHRDLPFYINSAVKELEEKISTWEEEGLITTDSKANYLMAYDETMYADMYYEKDLTSNFLFNEISNVNDVILRKISMVHNTVGGCSHHEVLKGEPLDNITKEFIKEENFNQFIKDNYIYRSDVLTSSTSLNDCYSKITSTYTIYSL